VKKLILSLSFVFIIGGMLLPHTALASQQVIMGHDFSPTTSASNQVSILFAAQGGQTTLDSSTTMPFAGTISSLYMSVDIPTSGTQSWTMTLLKNKVTTAITCTVNSSSATNAIGNQICSDTSDTVSFVAGDHFALQTTPANTPGGADMSYSMIITPTTANDTLLGAESPGSIDTANETYAPFDRLITAPVTTQASSTALVFGEAGTIKKIYAAMIAPTGNGPTRAFTFLDGIVAPSSPALASTSLTCTISNASICNDTVDTVSVAQGDLFDLASVPTGTPGGIRYGVGVDFVPTVPGDFDLITGAVSNGTIAITSTRWFVPTGGLGGALKEASTSSITNAMTVTSMYAWIGNAAGGASTRTFVVMKNQASTTISCVMTGSANTCNATGSAVFNAGDTIDIKEFAAGAGGATDNGYSVAVVANTNPTTPSTPAARTLRLFQGFKIKLVSGTLKLLQKQ
jgi:hypothetical protein